LPRRQSPAGKRFARLPRAGSGQAVHAPLRKQPAGRPAPFLPAVFPWRRAYAAARRSSLLRQDGQQDDRRTSELLRPTGRTAARANTRPQAGARLASSAAAPHRNHRAAGHAGQYTRARNAGRRLLPHREGDG
jgi:hypothetical protein